MNAHSQELIGFLHGLQSLPESVLADTRRCLLDALGCGLFGSSQPWSRMAAAEFAGEEAVGTCTVLGRMAGAPAAAAVFCNAVSIHGYELDDVIAGSIVHPAAAVVPAALAAAEIEGASGMELLVAIAAGYEMMHRVALSMGVTPSRAGFHVSSLVAPLGAAMAAGRILRLSSDQLVAAIGIASSAASGIKAFAAGHGGGMAKRLHHARGAEAGLRACLLAARGFDGPPFAIDGKWGLLELFGRETAKAEMLAGQLGDRWAVSRVWFKLYPICGWIQPVAQILSMLRGERRLSATEIQAVRIGVSSYAAANNGDPAPRDTMGMQYSIPFCAALALLGNPLDPGEYGDARLHDPEMRAVQPKVELFISKMAEEAYPGRFAAEVELHLADGTVERMAMADCRGTPGDPFSDAELEAKFATLAGKALGDRARDAARQILAGAVDARILARILRPASSAALAG